MEWCFVMKYSEQIDTIEKKAQETSEWKDAE